MKTVFCVLYTCNVCNYCREENHVHIIDDVE